MKLLLRITGMLIFSLLVFSSCSRDELEDFDTYYDGTLMRTGDQLGDSDPWTRQEVGDGPEDITSGNTGIDPDEDEDDDDDDEYRHEVKPPLELDKKVDLERKP